MDRKLDAGALLVGAAAVLLIVSLSLDWFGPLSAWEAFEVLDLVLLAGAIVAVAAAFGRADQRLLVGAAVVVLVVVATQVAGPPPSGRGLDREVGAWLGLVGALGLLGGAALVSAQIAVTVDVRARERRQRVAAVDNRGGGAAPASHADDAAPAPAPAPRGGDAAPAPGGSEKAEPDAPLFSKGEPTQPTPVDRFAPPAGADPDATQAFPAPAPADDER